MKRPPPKRKTPSATKTAGSEGCSTPKTKSGSLYFHVPFCTKKCRYCHFFVLPDKPQDRQLFLQSLRKEWELQPPLPHLESVYFGGGTPSLLGPEAIAEILSWVNPPKNAEITLEVNPEDVTAEKMAAFADAGINRVSLGVQTLHDPLLVQIGRTHTASQALKAVETTARFIPNLSIDLMIDLPNQTLGQVEKTCYEVTELPITHLSLYNLVLEPPSLFYSQREKIRAQMPKDDVPMLETAIDILQSGELERYEISAFAKPGFQSHHNTGYWTGRPFRGLGPSAFSYWEGERFSNVKSLRKYCELLEEGKLPIDFHERLSPDASARERFAIHLRLTEGAPIPEECRVSVEQLASDGFLALEGDHARLTSKGQLFYDTVATELI